MNTLKISTTDGLQASEKFYIKTKKISDENFAHLPR